MGLENLDKETRAAVVSAFQEAIHEDDGMKRVMAWFAETDEKGSRINGLMDQTKDLAESFEEMERSFAEERKNFAAQLSRVGRNVYGDRGRYCGAFGSESDARSVGLSIMAGLGNKRANEALKSEFSDVHQRVLGGDINSDGGAIKTPAELINLVLWLVDSYGVFTSKVPGMPMGSDETTWTKDKGEPFMNVIGEHQKAVTENSLDLISASLKPKEWYTLFIYPRSLEEDSAVPLADLMARRIAWAFAYWIDKCGFMGTGGSDFFGIYGLVPKLKAIGTGGLITAAGVTSFANVTDQHLLNVQGLLPQWADTNYSEATAGGPAGNLGGRGRAEWYCHRQFFFGVFARLARATGGLTAEEFEGRRSLAYNGAKQNIVQVMPSVGADQEVPVIYGDLAIAAMRGVRRQLQIEQSTEVRWLQRQIAVMGTMRHDIVVQNIGDANNPEAITGLKLAA